MCVPHDSCLVPPALCIKTNCAVEDMHGLHSTQQTICTVYRLFTVNQLSWHHMLETCFYQLLATSCCVVLLLLFIVYTALHAHMGMWDINGNQKHCGVVVLQSQ